jgi:hypothetical protein
MCVCVCVCVIMIKQLARLVNYCVSIEFEIVLDMIFEFMFLFCDVCCNDRSSPPSPDHANYPEYYIHKNRYGDISKLALPHIFDPLSDSPRGIIDPVSEGSEPVTQRVGAGGLVDGAAEALACCADDVAHCAEEAAC